MLGAAVVVMLAVPLVSCITTKAGMYRVFSDDVKRLIGRPYHEAFESYQCQQGAFNPDSGEADYSKCEKLNRGFFLSSRRPDEIRELGSGRSLRIFIDHWGAYNVKPRGACTVFVEVDASSEMVVNAWSEGIGCFRAY